MVRFDIYTRKYIKREYIAEGLTRKELKKKKKEIGFRKCNTMYHNSGSDFYFGFDSYDRAVTIKKIRIKNKVI